MKRLRMQMESSLGLLIEKEIEYRGGGAEDPSFGQQSLINHITDNIIKSEQYVLLHNDNTACSLLYIGQINIMIWENMNYAGSILTQIYSLLREPLQSKS